MRLLIALIFTSIIAKSQDIDTLLPHILSLQSDTEKVNQLYKQGFALRNSDPQNAYLLGKLAEKNALKSGSGKHLAKSYNLLGILYYKKGDFKKALAYHREALQLRKACGDIFGIANSNTNLGNIYSDIKLFPQAEEAYLLAMQSYNELGKKEQTANALMNLGILKFNLKQYDASIENYLMAIKIANELNDYEIKVNCMQSIAQAYGVIGKFEKALAYNEDVLKLRQLMENDRGMADSYLNLALLYMYEGTYDIKKAKEYIDTAFAIGNKYEDFDIKKICYKSYALYYNEVKDFEKAFKSFQKFDHIKDSLLLFQNSNQAAYTFDEAEEFKFKQEEGHSLNNRLLLLTCLLIAIFTPFILIRFKR
jgi:tetratricopeptide (TPR) repeat protein